MSRYTDEERTQMLARIAATLQRADVERESGAEQALMDHNAEREDQLALLDAAMRRPVEDKVERWKREAEEQAARVARQRARREQRDLERRILALVDQRIEALRGELRAVAEACGKAVENIDGALSELYSVANKPVKVADERMEALFERLELKLDELPRAGEVIDIPNPLRSRAN